VRSSSPPPALNLLAHGFRTEAFAALESRAREVAQEGRRLVVEARGKEAEPVLRVAAPNGKIECGFVERLVAVKVSLLSEERNVARISDERAIRQQTTRVIKRGDGGLAVNVLRHLQEVFVGLRRARFVLLL
jgi:hypothetical protein